MVADPKRELHTLIDRLDLEDTATLLDSARRLVARRREGHAPPVLHIAPPLASIDALRGDIFPADEDTGEFDATIRRWRDEDSVRRG